MRFLSYVLVGGFNTLLGIATYGAFLRLGLPYPAASGLSLLIGIVVGFQAHRAFVFKRIGGFRRYVSVWLGIYVLANGLIWVLQRWLGPFLAAVLTTPLNAVAAFLALKRFVFTGPGTGGQGMDHFRATSTVEGLSRPATPLTADRLSGRHTDGSDSSPAGSQHDPGSR